jgi:hypothetical protein
MRCCVSGSVCRVHPETRNCAQARLGAHALELARRGPAWHAHRKRTLHVWASATQGQEAWGSEAGGCQFWRWQRWT